MHAVNATHHPCRCECWRWELCTACFPQGPRNAVADHQTAAPGSSIPTVLVGVNVGGGVESDGLEQQLHNVGWRLRLGRSGSHLYQQAAGEVCQGDVWCKLLGSSSAGQCRLGLQMDSISSISRQAGAETRPTDDEKVPHSSMGSGSSTISVGASEVSSGRAGETSPSKHAACSAVRHWLASASAGLGAVAAQPAAGTLHQHEQQAQLVCA